MEVIPIISFVIFSTKTISEKQKQLRVLLRRDTQSDSKGFWELPFTFLSDNQDVEESAETFLRSLTGSDIHREKLDCITDPSLKDTDGNRNIRFPYYVILPEDQTDITCSDTDVTYQWFDYPDGIPKLNSCYKFEDDISNAFNIISNELKGVELVETILSFLPNQFMSRDAEYVAANFYKDKKDMFIFFRYLREQTKPESTTRTPLHRVNQKVREIGIEEVDPDKKRRGKPALIFEKVCN